MNNNDLQLSAKSIADEQQKTLEEALSRIEDYDINGFIATIRKAKGLNSWLMKVYVHIDTTTDEGEELAKAINSRISLQ